jgi:Ca-activated chloride channel family protein
LVLALVSACGDDSGAVGAMATGSTSDTSGGPAFVCLDGGPLMFGDAPWVKAPITPPGDMGMPGQDDGAGDDNGIFLASPDGGGVGFECDLFAQDCPMGEKCVPWANDGGSQWNATRCSPIAEDPAATGQPCTVEGGPTSGVDDCSGSSICWDVDRSNEGTCVALCQGDEADPQCHGDQWCFQGFDGTVAVCMPAPLCELDGVCQCMCPWHGDPDCAPDQCTSAEAGPPDELVTEPPIALDGVMECPETQDPVVLYMSNDDSNSQASPILARRMITDGYVVPASRIRIHEFLNYFELSGPSQQQAPATVGIEARRTDASQGELTLVLRAQGRMLDPADRPPMNLVFSLDTSGSMSGERIELLKDTMTAIAGQLRTGDVVSVVTWSSSQSVDLAGYAVMGPDDPELLAIIANLQANGSTDLHGGLVTAYALAGEHHIDDGWNRVVLISDGGANAGITDLDLIASEASDADGESTYMVGVGVGEATSYRDDLMNAVTDAGKGAYVFVDTQGEAAKQFGPRFLANVAVSARNVRMELTLPWYFGVKRFHGEEISENPAEVEPQHLAPNDAMVFHQIISACDASLITTCDSIGARVEYVDPITGELGSDELVMAIDALVVEDAPRLYKADVVVGYAKALVVIESLVDAGLPLDAVAVAQGMQAWAQDAATELGDGEVQEIADLMGTYATHLAP